jgi:excinuclease ABC subunit B
MQNQTIYVSATPAPRELEWSQGPASAELRRPPERPNSWCGLIDPKVTLKPLKGQIDDLIEEVPQARDAKRSARSSPR